MTESFPSTFPKDYRVVYSPGVNLIWSIFDAEDELVGRFVGKVKALEFSWKRYLNRLNYHGVATLLASLQDEGEILGLKQQVAAIRSAKESKEARILELQREVTESEGREKATSDCAEAALQSWKTEANEAHAKVESLEAELVAVNATLKRIECMAQAAKKVSDTLMGCFENPVVPAKVTTASTQDDPEPEPEPEPGPIDPAFDFNGPIPEGMPSGYRVEHLGDRKPMAYRVHGPGGVSISCFTSESAHEKAWEHIRDINEAKVKAGAPVPRLPPVPAKTDVKHDPNRLPDGYTQQHTSSRYPNKLTRPDKSVEYFATREQLVKSAWLHFEKHEPAATAALAVTKPAQHNRKNPPPSYFIKAAFGHYRFALVRPNGKEEKFFTDRDALEAAWQYYDEERTKSDPGSKPHPANSPSAKPPEGYMFTSTNRSAKYRLHFPGDRTADFNSKVARYDAAWDHFRNREPAKEAANDEPVNLAPPSLPPGFKEAYMGHTSQRPYKLTEPGGACRYYKTPAELVEGAWKISKESVQTRGVHPMDPPPGYVFTYDSDTRDSWKLQLPGGASIWFASRQARLKAAWVHNAAPFGKKAERIEGMEKYPASFEHTVPNGYKRENTGAKHNPHKLTNPGGSCQYFADAKDLHETAWEHFRVNSIKKDPNQAARNAKRMPPGYTETYGNPQKNYELVFPNKDKMCFLSHDARLLAAWAHFDAPLDNMQAIRGMGDFPRSFEHQLPPGYRVDKMPTSNDNDHKLTAPDHGVYFLPTISAARKQAWEHWRVSRNKAEDEKAKAAVSTAALKAPKATPRDRSKLPPGFDFNYLGLAAMTPYKLIHPGDHHECFRSREEMLKTAWGHYDAPKDERTTYPYEDVPTGYSCTFDHKRGKYPHWLKTPAGDTIRFRSRDDMLGWAAANSNNNHALMAGIETSPTTPPEKTAPKELAPLPLPPPPKREHTPGMMPPHFNHMELEGATLRAHKLSGPNGYTDYFHTYTDALEAAWRVARAHGPNWQDKSKPAAPKSEPEGSSFSTTPMPHSDLPRGYKAARLHKPTEFPHMLQTPPEEALFFRTWDDMIRWAAADFKRDYKTCESIVTSANKARLEPPKSEPEKTEADERLDAAEFDFAFLTL